MTLPASDPAPRSADQVKLDSELAETAERRKAAALARNQAARQFADYAAGELEGVSVTPVESATQLAMYRRAVADHKAAHEDYLAADRAWILG